MICHADRTPTAEILRTAAPGSVGSGSNALSFTTHCPSVCSLQATTQQQHLARPLCTGSRAEHYERQPRRQSQVVRGHGLVVIVKEFEVRCARPRRRRF